MIAEVSGVFEGFTERDKTGIAIDFLANEVIKTSEIEGEYLHRESVEIRCVEI